MMRHVVPVVVRLRSLAARFGGARRLRRGAVLAVALASVVYGLVTSVPAIVPSALADDQTESYRVRVAPFTRTVAAYNYENRTTRVRVAPFTRTVAAYNYENRTTRVRVAPFSRSVPAYNYQTVCIWLGCSRVRVAPFSRTVAAYNYENRTTRVRVAPFTRTVAAYNYENRTRSVSHTHTCPSGQHLHGHDTCHTDHTCGVGYTLSGHSSCRWVGCPSGQHAHSVQGTGSCHADHTCSAGQHLDGHDACHADHTCAVGFNVVNHDQCRWVGCPSGQHAHSVQGTGSCHADHAACASGQHRHSHDDACHADHTCAVGFNVVNHDQCRWVGCPSGQHAHSVQGTGSCHADHSCPEGQILHSHDQCRAAPPPQCTPGPGEHRHTLFNNQVTCHAGDHLCPTGQHATSTSAHGHVSGCHSTTNPAHRCPGNQVAGSTTAHGHVSGCRTVVPPQCTPGPGEHRHTLFNNQVTCHADHTCPEGQHLDGHDTCHADHTCPPGQELSGHDTCRPSPPENLTVVCRTSDAKVRATWDPVAGATYSATVTQTPPGLTPTSQRLAPRALSSTSMEMDGTAGWTYAVAVTAVIGSNSSDFVSTAATCTAVRPPAPTGVTATCQSGVLTVTWNQAGAGLAKAASYKPRIFTGDPPTESASWTTNAAGHTTTTATIPAQGEPALPATGAFQVKVKAANTAGDSAYSQPAEATCGPPGPITGLKCTAITKDQITIKWNTAAGAQNYNLTIAPTSTGTPQLPLNVPAVQGRQQSHTFVGLHSGHLHRIAVQPANTKLGPTATLQCTTVNHDWLTVACSSSRVLDIDWGNPPDASQNYTVKAMSPPDSPATTVIKIFPVSGTNGATRWVTPGPIAQTFVQRSFERRYRVLVKSNGANGPTYSQTVEGQCPNSSKPNWNTPNDDYDEPGLKWTWGIELPGFLSWPGNKLHDLIVGNQNPLLLPDSRTCRVPSAEELRLDADLDRVCEESWSESMNLRMDAILDWRDVDILGAWDASTLEGIVNTATSIEDIASTIKDELDAGKTLKMATRRAVLGFAASEAIFYVKNASQNQVWARISPHSQCMNSDQLAYDQNTGWVPVTTSVSVAENVNGYKTMTVTSITYCTNNPPN